VNVCLDARKLWDSGIGTYIRGLLEGMADLEKSPHWDFILRPDAVLPAGVRSQTERIMTSSAGNYSVAELFIISRLANRCGSDLFHAPHYVIPVRLNLPLVATVHDLIHLKFPQYFSPIQRAYARWMLGRVGHNAKFILTVSQHSKQDLVNALHIPPEKIVVTYSGVSRRYFQAVSQEAVGGFRKQYGLSKDYLLYIGNLKPHKNVSGLIESWNRLPDSIRPPLVILGSHTDQYPELVRQTRELGRSKEITFRADMPDENMLLLHHGAAAYVQPSWYEGFGSPPLEAMACGRPVAVSNRASLPEIAGPAALMFDPGDREQMTTALQRLLTDSQLRADLVQKGLLRAREFDWPLIASRTLEVYRKALGEL
jgi:glycosyltransferase involved in cell wall biosynthesis